MSENRLLLIDDDPRICRLLRRVGEKIGFNTRELNDSSKFESTYSEFEPDVILLDLNMPGRDGIELLRFLADRRSPAAICLISGEDNRVISTTARLGRELGLNVSAQLHKPVDVSVLRDELIKHYKEERKITEADLEDALADNQLFVCYQPKIELQTDRVVGAEALVRWGHPNLGAVFPDEFIPLTEESGLIVALTYKVLAQVLRESVEFGQRWQGLSFAINLSPTLLTDLTLPDRVIETLANHDFDPARLVLEVTESGAMENPLATMDILTRLRLKGVRLSIDDFGTGYSSLVQLYRLPYSELKVDKSFVIAMTNDEEAATIVRSTISLGHSMGLKIVAEGIEDQETMDLLKDLGCDVGQGYHIGRPVEAPQFESWLKQRLG